MGDFGSTPAVYSARPRITLDGTARPVLAAEGLLTLLVEETTDGLYRCEATFGNWGPSGDGAPNFAFFDRQTFDFGTRLVLEAGAGGSAAQLFDGVITGLEAHYPNARPPELTVLAEDRLQEMRMTRRTRTFEDVTTEDVLNQVASEHGLQAVLDVPAEPSYAVLAQVNQSDLAFLRDRVRSVDAEVWITGDTLHAQRRGDRREDEVTLTYGQGLREFSVLADLAHQCTAFVVSGWDSEAKERITGRADEQAVQGETDGGESGPAILQAAFGDRIEQMVHTVPFTEAEARPHAEAAFRQRARRFVEGRGVALGDARLRVGARVTLRGLGRLFNGAYTVVGVQHTFDIPTGFRTRFDVQRPAIDVP